MTCGPGLSVKGSALAGPARAGRGTGWRGRKEKESGPPVGKEESGLGLRRGCWASARWADRGLIWAGIWD